MTQRPSLAIRYAQRTDIGRQRRANEDTSAIYELMLEGRPAVIAAIADGMGGAAAGAEASQLAVSTAIRTLAARLVATTPQSEREWEAAVFDALHAANHVVHVRSSSTGGRNGMGTTLLVSVIWNRRVRIAHIGDSRAYLVRPAARRPQIVQLTADHTIAAELVGRGALSATDAIRHPLRHQLARSVGPEPRIEPELAARNLRSGERLLLCSDGLSLHVGDGELARAVSDAPTPQAACDRLVNLANQRGGRDNVTVVVLAVDRDDDLQ